MPIAILAGASLAFFALIGFEDSVNVAEETRDPSRVFPRALFLGLGVAGVVYMLVTVIASMAVPTDSSSSSDGPLLEVVDQGPLGDVDQGVRGDRAVRADQRRADQPDHGLAARLRHEPRGDRAARRSAACTRGASTPWVAILFTASLAALLVVVGDLETLADTTVLLLLFVFVVVNAAVLVLRRDAGRPRALPRPDGVPVLGVLACVALIVQKAFDDPRSSSTPAG